MKELIERLEKLEEGRDDIEFKNMSGGMTKPYVMKSWMTRVDAPPMWEAELRHFSGGSMSVTWKKPMTSEEAENDRAFEKKLTAEVTKALKKIVADYDKAVGSAMKKMGFTESARR